MCVSGAKECSVCWCECVLCVYVCVCVCVCVCVFGGSITVRVHHIKRTPLQRKKLDFVTTCQTFITQTLRGLA